LSEPPDSSSQRHSPRWPRPVSQSPAAASASPGPLRRWPRSSQPSSPSCAPAHPRPRSSSACRSCGSRPRCYRA